MTACRDQYRPGGVRRGPRRRTARPSSTWTGDRRPVATATLGLLAGAPRGRSGRPDRRAGRGGNAKAIAAAARAQAHARRTCCPARGDRRAGRVLKRLLHAGPPIAWERMCGPMRGAVIGAIAVRGLGGRPRGGRGAGGVAAACNSAPCHDAGAVGPMAGVVSPSMPVVVVDDVAHGTRAFATLNEGLGKVLRFGAYDASVLTRLRWMADDARPGAVRARSAASGPVDLKMLTGQALQMGDECHNRNVAATALFARLHRAGAGAHRRRADAAASCSTSSRPTTTSILNLSMAACKASLDAAHGVAGLDARDGHGAQRRRVRHPRQRTRRPRGSPRRSTVPDGLYFARLRRRRRQSGPRRQRDHRDRWDRRLRHGGGAGDRALRRRRRGRRRSRYTRRDGPHHARAQPGLRPAQSRASRHADRHRPAAGRRERHARRSSTPGIAHREPGVGQIGAGIARAPLGVLRRRAARSRPPAGVAGDVACASAPR